MNAFLIIIIYSITVFGLSNIMIFGDGPFNIFGRIRNLTTKMGPSWEKLFSCMMCLPANFGWVFSLINIFVFTTVAFTPFNILLGVTAPWWFMVIGDTMFTSGVVWLIYRFDEFLGKDTVNIRYPKDETKEDTNTNEKQLLND